MLFVPYWNNKGSITVTLVHFIFSMYDNGRGGMIEEKKVAECNVMITNKSPLATIVPRTEIKVKRYGMFGKILGKVFTGPIFKNVTKPSPAPMIDDA